MKNTKLKIEGRHDPCIVPRALPVIEAAAALVLLDNILEREGEVWKN
jgi:chorismate synthase